VTIYFLFEYVSGKPKINDTFRKFQWVDAEKLPKIKNIFEVNVKIMNEVEAAIRTMNVSQDEVLVEVNKKNKEIGTIIKRDAHINPKRYHRAAHIMIFNSKGQVVLQQRSWNKAIGPGRWDMHGGHQIFGQTMEQTARQELAEELGVHAELKLHHVGLRRLARESEYYYLYYGISDGPYGFDKNEVQQIKEFDCDKLLKGGYDKKYDIMKHVYEYTRNLKPFWSKLTKKK